MQYPLDMGCKLCTYK